jgi:hypothetical protein
MNGWIKWTRPGFFGRRKDEIAAALDSAHGPGNWKLAWAALGPCIRMDGMPVHLEECLYPYEQACKLFYEESYFRHFRDQKQVLDDICSYGECYDNDVENVGSGRDYTVQRAYSTHIQDIAVRNVLDRLGRKFSGPPGRLLQIRGKDSDGFRLGLGPGQVPFYDRSLIAVPSLAPKWAQPGSVEDFWQSNKWVCKPREGK